MQNLSLIENQHLMQSIEENTECLDLLNKTLEVEERQKKRLLEISLKKKKELEEGQMKELFDGFNTTTTSILDQEDAHSKKLVEVMAQNTTPSNGPIVRVVTNVQGNLLFIYLVVETNFSRKIL